MSRFSTFAQMHLNPARESGDEVTCLCPFHEDTSPSFRFNTRSGLWICHGCDMRGEIHKLAFLLHASIVDSGVSAESLHRRLRVTRRHSADTPPPTLGESALKRFEFHPYWTDLRGLSAQTVVKFQLGYDPIVDKLTIPIRTSYGELAGVIYRRLDNQKPKYIYPKGFAVGRSLFPSWMVRFSESKVVALVEGPVDALAMWDVNVPALAVLGSRLSEGQLRLLQSLSIRRVVLMFDNDTVGRSSLRAVRQTLKSGGIRVSQAVYLGKEKDPAALDKDERKEMFRVATSSKH